MTINIHLHNSIANKTTNLKCNNKSNMNNHHKSKLVYFQETLHLTQIHLQNYQNKNKYLSYKIISKMNN